jgi:hypothetical protein
MNNLKHFERRKKINKKFICKRIKSMNIAEENEEKMRKKEEKNIGRKG